MDEVDSREINWTIVFTEAGTVKLEANVSGYYNGNYLVQTKESLAVTVLAHPPVIDVLSPENKTYTTSSVPLTFTINEPSSWIGYSLDGQVNVTISGNTTLASLPDGTHYVTVYANDTAGNTSCSDIIYFTVSVPPQPPPLWQLFIVAVASISIVAAISFAVLRKK